MTIEGRVKTRKDIKELHRQFCRWHHMHASTSRSQRDYSTLSIADTFLWKLSYGTDELAQGQCKVGTVSRTGRVQQISFSTGAGTEWRPGECLAAFHMTFCHVGVFPDCDRLVRTCLQQAYRQQDSPTLQLISWQRTTRASRLQHALYHYYCCVFTSKSHGAVLFTTCKSTTQAGQEYK